MYFLNSAHVRPGYTLSAIVTSCDNLCIVSVCIASPVLLPVMSLQCVCTEASHKDSYVGHVCSSVSASLNRKAAIRPSVRFL